MKTIKISAVDNLFFGTGRPFTMGEDSWTTGIFPPTPETIYGFLRACYFLDKMQELKKANVSGADNTLNLQIENFGLTIRDKIGEQLLFPIPKDLIYYKDKPVAEKLTLKKNDNPVISHLIENLAYKLTYTGKEKLKDDDETYYLTTPDFENYLKDRFDDIKPVKLSSCINAEPKIGNKRNRFNRDENQLYRINLVRPQQIDSELSIWVSYSGIDFTTSINRLGGEGKLAYIEPSDPKMPVAVDNKFKQGEIVKAYLQTPAIFEHGNEPDFENCEVIAAATGKPLLISGFNIREPKPKEVEKAVPAGSVYCLMVKADGTLPAKIGMSTHKGYGNVIYRKVM